MTQLSVNVNKIALLRNQRGVGVPSVVGLLAVALRAEINGITVQLRPNGSGSLHIDVVSDDD